MNEEERRKMEETVGAGMEAGAEVGAAVGAEAGAETGAEAGMEAGAEMSAKDKARSWMAGKNPDLNMDDEEAYYGAVGDIQSKYDQYEKNTENLQNAVDKNGLLGQAIVKAMKNPDFNLIAYIKEETGMDLTEAMDDEAFAQQMSEATANWLAAQARSKESKQAIEANFGPSMEKIDAFADAQGQSEEAKQAMKTEMFDIIDQAFAGNFDGLYEKLYQASNYDGAVENARAEGEAAGRQTKVEEKLKTFPKTSPRGGGSQAVAEVPKQKEEEEYNPFLAKKKY